jgi:hypothetical protein
MQSGDQQDTKAQFAELQSHFLNFVCIAFETASITKTQLPVRSHQYARTSPGAGEIKSRKRKSKSDHAHGAREIGARENNRGYIGISSNKSFSRRDAGSEVTSPITVSHRAARCYFINLHCVRARL